MKKIILMAAIAAGLINVANAAPGAYVQVQGGVGGMDTTDYSDGSGPYNEVSIRSGAAYRLAGGYLWGQDQLNYGVEAGYSSYPDNEYTVNVYGYSLTETYKGHYIDLLGVAKYNFSSNSESGLYVIGKVGAALVSQKFEVSDNYGYASYTDDKQEVKPEAALGIGYDFNKNVSLDLTFNHVFADQADPNGSESDATQIASVSTLLVGLTYHFS